jgi:hypothetical protein
VTEGLDFAQLLAALKILVERFKFQTNTLSTVDFPGESSGSIAGTFQKRQENATCGKRWYIMPPLPGGSVLFRRKRKPASVRRFVSDDWIAALPREKAQLFDAVVRRWESVYAMMSVSLDEALSLRARGELVCARQQISITGELHERLASALIDASIAMADRGRHVSDVPIVEPLNADFFRGDTAQSAASWNSILHHVLLGDRSRFFHKLRILSDTTDRLNREFIDTAADISEGSSVQPGACWQCLDSLHYDISTCLRELEVLMKCFLRALPAEQVSAFSHRLDAPVTPRRTRSRPSLTRVSA